MRNIIPTETHTGNSQAVQADSAAEIRRLQTENEQLRKNLSGKCTYIRQKANELLEIMGTRPLLPEELDDENLVELDPLGIIFNSIRHVLDNLKITNAQLNMVNKETAAIFAAAEVGILLIDSSKRIQSCNNKLHELFFPDKALSLVLGKTCNDEVCRNNRPDEGCACEMIMAGCKSVRINSWKFHDRVFNVVATPIRDSDENVEFIVVVYNEITEIKAAEEQLNQLNTELESRISQRTVQLETANKNLEAFCYSISHDLRAPLRHINGFASILVDDYANSLNTDGQTLLKRISKASRHMGTLIDDLLHFSRVSKSDISPIEVDLSQFARRIATMFRESEPQRKVEFRIEENLFAQGDASLLEIVLQNLIGNAWKYSSTTDDACIEFGRTVHDGKDAFFVRDNGVGFDMLYKDKLFRVFERLHGEQFEGTGIGLATVQRIIERHGGSVWAEGSLGKGATIYFNLPD
jgi:signal transduction histidine kinase